MLVSLLIWLYIAYICFSGHQLSLVNKCNTELNTVLIIKHNLNHRFIFKMPYIKWITPRHKCVAWFNSSCFIKARKWGEASVLCTPRARSRQMNNRGKHNDSTGLAPHTHRGSVQLHKAPENGFTNPQKQHSHTVTISLPNAPHTCRAVQLKEINTATKCVYKRPP